MSSIRVRSIKRNLIAQCGAVALLAAGPAGPAFAQEGGAAVAFEMPAQSLDKALKSFGVTADRQVFFDASLIKGKRANPVAGEMAPMEALDKILYGSGLVYEATDTDVILIKTAQQAADAQPFRVAQIDEDEDRDAPRVNEELLEADTIIVTGTNIRGVTNPTTPVLQFDREDIDLSGAATVEEFLRIVPQHFNDVNRFGIESANDFSGVDNVTRGSGINLRGLGGGTTLTLLNGRRMSASGTGSFVDVSILPLGAIERVEVLTDGASAIYGSDAVAGVVNFITRKDYEGFELRARYGTVTDGSQEDYGVSAAGGFSWGSGGALLGIDYSAAEPLLTSERDYIDLERLLIFDPGLQDDPIGFIGNDEERIGGTLSLNQSITDRLTFTVDSLFSNRDTETISNIIPREIRFEQDSYFINTKLEYLINEDVSLSLFYDYSREDGRSFDELDNFAEETFENRLHVVEGLLSGRLLNLPSGDGLSFALGGQYREESFDFDLISFPAPLERDVTSVYGELLIPVVGELNALPFVKAFDVSLAGRFESYSDFGDTFNPKVGLHWAVNDELSFRASYSEAFRAPPLIDVFGQETGAVRPRSNAEFIAFPEISGNPGGETVSILVGGANPNLMEETADVWSAGVEYEPNFVPGLKASATYFMYDYADKVERAGLSDVLQDPSFSDFAIQNPDADTVQSLFNRLAAAPNRLIDRGFTVDDIEFIAFIGQNNLAGRKVEGLDFAVDYQKETSFGIFSSSVNATYLFVFDTQVTEQSTTIDQLNVLYRPVDLRLRGNLAWSRDGLTAFLAINHTSDYRDNRDRSIANDIDAYTTVDLALSYDTAEQFDNVVLNGTTLSFNIRNLFDQDPPFVETIDGLNFDTANADPFGRQISFTLTKSF